MRLAALLAFVLAACSDNGAHLTFKAPEGPAAAATFKVVLATPELVPTVRNQRVSADSTATHEVSYYLQRTLAGGSYEDVDVDGFTVRVEPDPGLADTLFVPFVIFYATDGAVVGVGTYHAGDVVTPSPIKVIRDEIDIYDLDVEPVTQLVDDNLAVAASQVQVVECSRDDQPKYTSGIVWRPKTGGEIRLLFPDDDSLDATGRALDLDCDGHAVTAESSGTDCDDSRAWFHRDAQETCDGYDTNCDNLQNLLVACATNSGSVCPSSPSGFAVCNDGTGEQTQCQVDPQCACAQNPSGCPRCLIDHSAAGGGNITPCQPGETYMYTPSICTDALSCTVEVIGTRGGWKAEVAADAVTPVFGFRATGVHYKFLFRLKRPEGVGASIPGVPGTSLGDVELAITGSDGTTLLRAFDIQTPETLAQCAGGGPFPMYCTP